mmetsp:Transcript_43868/g.78845  ORF Transcript_43868/g.78845 Transcript_43868/m.78845 type:complete len:95 (+) Transcript_43868:48-332(+)
MASIFIGLSYCCSTNDTMCLMASWNYSNTLFVLEIQVGAHTQVPLEDSNASNWPRLHVYFAIATGSRRHHAYFAEGGRGTEEAHHPLEEMPTTR